MAFLLAALLAAVSLFSVVLVRMGLDARTPALSETAQGVDAQFALTLVVTGVVFLAVHALLLWVLWRHHAGRSGQPSSVHENRVFERVTLVVVAVVFLFLAVRGQGVWARLIRVDADAAPVQVQVLAEQFAWNVRYAGGDARFGRTRAGLMDTRRNPMGLDPDDPAGRDDVVLLNEVVAPVGQTVVLNMQAKDVIHSFFVPALRLKQDVVPGLVTRLTFRADRVGRYEIACAELCGLGHYRMKGTLRIVTPQEYRAWLQQQGGAR